MCGLQLRVIGVGAALICISLLQACSRTRGGLEAFEWSKEQSDAELKKIDKLEKLPKSAVGFTGGQVEIQPQAHAGIEIEGSFIKKVTNLHGDPEWVRADVTTDRRGLNKVRINKDLDSVKRSLQSTYPWLTPVSIHQLRPLIVRVNDKFTLQYELIHEMTPAALPVVLRWNDKLKLVFRAPAGASGIDALVFPEGPKLSTLARKALQNVQIMPVLTHPLFNVASEISVPIEQGASELAFPVSDPRFEEVQVFYYVEKALSWIQRALGVQLRAPVSIVLHIGAPEKTNAAFYFQGRVRLGAGDGQAYQHIPQDMSIVVHEVMHHLVSQMASLPYEKEGGSLNEAFCDYLTSEYRGRPTMGDMAYMLAPYKRSVENKEYWRVAGQGLYKDSLIISGLMWAVARALPENKGLLVAVETLVRLTPISNFADFLKRYQQAIVKVLTPDEQSIAYGVLETRNVPIYRGK
jgi:hypothetical protein